MYLLNLFRRARRWFDDPSKHLLRIELNRSAMEYNLSQLKKLFNKHYLAIVLKSNAYGHGLKEIGMFLNKRKEVDYLVVDSIIEAKSLRDNGISKPIIILGYVPRAAIISLKKLGKIVFVINSKEQAEILQVLVDFKLRVHIKVDTGMNRQGIAIEELEHVLKVLSFNKKIKIEGMLSHLADADGPSGLTTQDQIRKWRIALDLYRHYNRSDKGVFHFAATAGTRYVSTAENNLVRVGIGFYGFDTTQDKQLHVKPVLSFWAKIVNLKNVKKGEKIGYGLTYTATKDMKIAVVPCGYYEGIPRSLSNNGFMYYREYALPIVGIVSMNLAVLDVGEVIEPLHIEDEVEVYAGRSGKLNSIDHVAEVCGTIPYEILAKIAPTIRRTIV